jgi:hypothetical protein
VCRNAATDDAERGVARAKARDDDAAAWQREGARVWRRCVVVVVVFSGRAPCGGRAQWSGVGRWSCSKPGAQAKEAAERSAGFGGALGRTEGV